MEKLIAERTSKIDASGIRKVFALASSLENPVNFSIGQPHFDVPEALKEEAISAIKNGFNKYAMTAGDALLKEKIIESIGSEIGWKQPSVLVSSGVSGGLLLSFLALIDPGDEVIIPDPYFVIYKHIINMLGGKCVYIDTYPEFGLCVDKIAGAITSKTKLIIINSPCNPTGMVYSQRSLEKLASVAAERNIVVLSDEIYEKFCYDCEYRSMARFYDRTIILRGFSKAYAMTGWRMGYMAVDETLKPVLEEMKKIQQYTFVCAPTPFQKAAIAAMDYDVNDLVADYQRKRDLIYEGIKGKFDLQRPEGAFYAFVKAPGGSATKFVEKAISNNLLIIPGNVFSEKDSHFRISFAATEQQIHQGIELLNSLAE